MSDPKNPDRGSRNTPRGGKQGDPGNPFANTKPPVYTPPVTGSANAYYLWAKQHGVGKQVADDVWYWAHQYGGKIGGGDNYAYYLTSVLLAESGADPKSGLNTSGHGVGIGQINPSVWTGTKIPWDKAGRKFTMDEDPGTSLRSYAVNLRFAAYYLARQVSAYGYQNAYAGPPGAASGGYNNGDSATQANILKTIAHVPKGVVFAPSQGSGPSVPAGTDTNPPPFKNPYVQGIDTKGKFHTTNDPNAAMKYDGVPLTISGFKGLQDQLSSLYVSYTGLRPSSRQVANYINNNWSPYTLVKLLANGKNFEKSPIFKQATQWNQTLKDLLPPGAKVPTSIIRNAVLNHWDSTAVAQQLRNQPGYLNSQEFKQNVATLLNVHQSVMGTADASSMTAVKDAALHGWSADQYARWLRSQPGYANSTEYQSKMLTFLDQLGVITGQRPTLKPGSTAPLYIPPAGSESLPPDKRVPGPPVASTTGTGLEPSFG